MLSGSEELKVNFHNQNFRPLDIKMKMTEKNGNVPFHNENVSMYLNHGDALRSSENLVSLVNVVGAKRKKRDDKYGVNGSDDGNNKSKKRRKVTREKKDGKKGNKNNLNGAMNMNGINVNQNGINMNGMNQNGINLNGISVNGISLNQNGMNQNIGMNMSGMNMNQNGINMNQSGISMNQNGMNQNINMNGINMSGMNQNVIMSGINMNSIRKQDGVDRNDGAICGNGGGVFPTGVGMDWVNGVNSNRSYEYMPMNYYHTMNGSGPGNYGSSGNGAMNKNMNVTPKKEGKPGRKRRDSNKLPFYNNSKGIFELPIIMMKE